MIEEDFEQRLLREWDEYRDERNERLHNFFVKVMIIFALLGITVSCTAYFAWNSAQDSKTGLCAIRQDAERRITLSKEFLKDNPKGIPGISAAVIQQNITRSQQTVDSLAFLRCPAVDPPPAIRTPTATPES